MNTPLILSILALLGVALVGFRLMYLDSLIKAMDVEMDDRVQEIAELRRRLAEIEARVFSKVGTTNAPKTVKCYPIKAKK